MFNVNIKPHNINFPIISTDVETIDEVIALTDGVDKADYISIWRWDEQKRKYGWVMKHHLRPEWFSASATPNPVSEQLLSEILEAQCVAI